MLATWVVTPNGQVYLNDLKRYIKNILLVPATQDEITIPAATAAGPGMSPVVIIEGGEDSVSEIYSLIGLFHDTEAAIQRQCFVEITDTAFRRNLMNGQIPVNHVFGTARHPFYLSESLALEGQQVMTLQFYNYSGTPAYFKLALEARKFQTGYIARQKVTQHIGELRQRKPFISPFWLKPENNIVLTAGQQRDFFFLISRDIFFCGFSIMAQSSSATPDSFEFQLQDSVSQRPLQNQPVNQTCGVGTAEFPFVLPTGLIADPNTRLPLKITNLTQDSITVEFTLAGCAVFALQNANPYAQPNVEVADPLSYQRGA